MTTKETTNGQIVMIEGDRAPSIIYLHKTDICSLSLERREHEHFRNITQLGYNENLISVLITLKWILRAKHKLKCYNNLGIISNLDYIEALAKLNEYKDELKQ